MSQDLEKAQANATQAPSVEETEFGGTSVSRGKRVIHFANGDILEQDSSDEEEDTPRKEPFSAPDNQVQISWRERSWRLCMKLGMRSLQTCDYIGGKLANLIGLNMAKYQYAIDQFHRDKPEGSKCRGADGGPVSEGAETVQLSPQKSMKYGATKLPGGPGLEACAEQSQRTTGSHNKGYQED